MEYIIITLLIIALIVSAWLWLRINQENKVLLIEKSKSETEAVQLREQLSAQLLSHQTLQTKADLELSQKRAEISQIQQSHSKLQSDYQHLQQKIEHQKDEMIQLQQRFNIEFENIANKLLEDKSRKFTEQNREKLDEILKPLGEKLKSFEEKVDRNHHMAGQQTSALLQELSSLQKLNQTMTTEAQNLTKALKGDSKIQGNWGEVILERILEKSGLEKNREYFVQDAVTTEEGRRLQPDVVIQLPDNKCIIVDSKVSLTAYERYVSADDHEKPGFLKAHIASIRSHIKGLSSKNYQHLYGSSSPDFVLLFIPIEPAFSVAMMQEDGLYNEAFDQNIVIVSTSTLLATLRTISSIWKQEYQNRNALEIAKRAGDLYDKFVAFVDDMQTVGSRIEQTSKAYEGAMNKLSTGKGNLIGRAEGMKKLGIRATKQLPENLLPDGDSK
jgi:DNA recombination protein RmuC